MNKKEIVEFCLSFDGAYEDYPFDETCLTIRNKLKKNRIFCFVFLESNPLMINLKADPEEAIVLRTLYEGVLPGYHMNKKHWNSVIMDGTVPDYEVKGMIQKSYELAAK